MLDKQQFFLMPIYIKNWSIQTVLKKTENIISNEKSGGFVRRFLGRFPLSS